jgi:hypothetical protein
MKNNNKQAEEIGKAIIKRFFDYYEDVRLDDETEFFPIFKVIIWGAVDSFKKDSQRRTIEKELKEYSKQLYISLWLLQAEEYEEEIDVEYEQKAALASLRISIGRYEKLITNRST